MPPIPSDERKRQRTFYNLKLAKSSTSTRCSLFTKNGSNTTGCDVGNPLCTKCQTKKVPRESRETMEEREKVTSEEKFSVVLFSILIEVPNCSIRYSRETVSFIIFICLYLSNGNKGNNEVEENKKRREKAKQGKLTSKRARADFLSFRSSGRKSSGTLPYECLVVAVLCEREMLMHNFSID